MKHYIQSLIIEESHSCCQNITKIETNFWLFFSNKFRIQYQLNGDTVALLAGQRACDSQVRGSSPGWAPLHGGLGQASFTCVPLSPHQAV